MKIKSREPLGWKEHLIKQGDAAGGWIVRSAQYQMLQHPEGGRCMAFGIAQLDNGEVLLLGSWRAQGAKGEVSVSARSADAGDTWTDLTVIPDSPGRPMSLAYLGGPTLTYFSERRFYSHDYGRTWPERIAVQPSMFGDNWNNEGNPLVEPGAGGKPPRIAEIGFYFRPDYTTEKTMDATFRWSHDGGRTWTGEVQPPEWKWHARHEGKSWLRGISEGSLVRAADGSLVAALRLDIPPRYLDVGHDDSLEGTGISISRDDGKTWSPITELYDAGRHHAHLLRMDDGRLVMTMTVRVDVREGRLAGYRRGCDALVSSDNGVTWNLGRRIILDDYELYDGKKWYNGECGHLYSTLLSDGRIITAHTNYLTGGISLIRWAP